MHTMAINSARHAEDEKAAAVKTLVPKGIFSKADKFIDAMLSSYFFKTQNVIY